MDFLKGFRNRKASNMDMLIIPVVGVVLAIVFIVTLLFIRNVVPNITSAENMDPAIKTEIDDQVNNRSVSLFDGMFLMMFIGFYLATIALAFIIDSHPIFFILSLMVWVISIPVTAIMANTYYSVSSSMGSYASDFIIIPWIFAHYVMILIVMAVPIAYVLYAKSRS
jgi:hypothetical protein